jgi:anti-sigma-K factor RskA
MADLRECGADAAAYALGALDPEEARRFEAHLDECATCREEVTAYRSVTEALPLTAPQHPVPGSVKRRVMNEVRADARQRGGRSAARTPWSLPRPAFGAAAVALVVVVVGLVLLISGGSSTREIQAKVAWTGGGAVLHVGDSGRGELVVSGMPQPPPGRVYEVWIKRRQQAPSPTNALFDVNSSGSASVIVPGSLHGVNAVLVTAEPPGGSLTPTRPPVIVAQLD